MKLRSSLSWSFAAALVVVTAGAARAETVEQRQRLASATFTGPVGADGCYYFAYAAIDRVTLVIDGVMQPAEQRPNLVIQKTCEDPGLSDFWSLNLEDAASQQFAGSVSNDLRLGYMVGTGTVIKGDFSTYPVHVALGWHGFGPVDDMCLAESYPEDNFYVTTHSQTRMARAAGIIYFEGRNLAPEVTQNPETYLQRVALEIRSEPPPAECPLF